MALERSTKDPLAIGIAVASLFIQLAAALFWGGKISQRVDDLEAHVNRIEAASEFNTKEADQHNVAIAVIASQITEIRDTVERIETRMNGSSGDKVAQRK